MRKQNRVDAEERHRRAVTQTTQWAMDAAAAGEYQDALSWMRVLETVEGELPAGLESLHARCVAVVQARAQAHDLRRAQFVDAA
jgi:hypothetical protein